MRSAGIGAPAVRMLLLAGVALALAAVLYAVALGVEDLVRADRDLRYPQIVGDWRFRDDASAAFARITGGAFAAAAALLMIVTLISSGLRRTAIVACVIGAGPLLGAALSWILAATDPVGGEGLRASQGAFPSGHAVMALSLGLALVVALPGRLRPLGGILAVTVAATVAVGIVALGWHYPSDVVGAFLISLAAASAVVAAVGLTDRPAAERRGHGRQIAVLVAGSAMVTGLSGAIALARLPDERPGVFVDMHPGFILYCVIASVLALACVTLFAHLLGMTRDRL